MPTVGNRAVLAAAYRATLKKIQAGLMPTLPIQERWTIFTCIDPNKPWTSLPKPKRKDFVSKFDANKLLNPRDGRHERQNRFSGPSLNREIPAAGGLYCVLQQQALVNERIEYSKRAASGGLYSDLQQMLPVKELTKHSKKPGTVALCGRCILRIRVEGWWSFRVAELTPHNPGALPFSQELGPDIEKELPQALSQKDPKALKEALDKALNFLHESGAGAWEQMTHPDDCSVARGIGLAIAAGGFRGLSAQTVRKSDRAEDERGDNLVLFGEEDRPIPGLFIEEASYFDNACPPSVEVFPVTFPGLGP